MRHRPNMVRSMHTARRVFDCESMCSSAPFDCMGFSYRYARLPDTAPNCYLTDSHGPPSEHHYEADRDCDVYQRLPSCRPMTSHPDTGGSLVYVLEICRTEVDKTLFP